MLMDKIAFIGIGQGGGNAVHELEKAGFENVFYVNTSIDDFEYIDTDDANKYHITGTKGMAKSRPLAEEVILGNDNNYKVCDAIYERYPMCTIYINIYTSGGGTGGGMGNHIASTLPEIIGDSKVSNSIILAPSKYEAYGIQNNTAECLEQAYDMLEKGLINSVQVLTNNSRDNKLKVNFELATLFQQMLDLREINPEGNLDEAEMETLLTTRGATVMLEFENEDFAVGLEEAVQESVYYPWIKDAVYLGYILNENQNTVENIELIEEVLGIPQFPHSTTWSKTNNVLIGVGMSPNKQAIAEARKLTAEKYKKKASIENEIKNEVDVVDRVDISGAMNKFASRKAPKKSARTGSSRMASRRANRESAMEKMEQIRSLGKK